MRQEPQVVQWAVLGQLRQERAQNLQTQQKLLTELQGMNRRGETGAQAAQRRGEIVNQLNLLEQENLEMRKASVAQLKAMESAGTTNPAYHREWAEGSGEAIAASRLTLQGLSAASINSRLAMLKSSVQEVQSASAVAKAEAQAVARAREANNFYRDGAKFESNIVDGAPKANLRLEYEQASRDLLTQAQRMQASGMSEEQVARWAVDRRNQLKIEYRELTPPEMLMNIEARNMEKYRNPLGPSVDQLRSTGKSWQQIIDGAARPGGQDLDFSPPGFNK
jgi:hypothetical protein